MHMSANGPFESTICVCSGTDRWDLQQAFIAAGVNVPRMYLIEPSANEIPRLK